MESFAPDTSAIAVFVAFVALSLGITWWAARRTQTASEFYTGGSRFGGFQNGLALAGDFMSAATFLGLAGLVFIGGADGMLFSSAIVVSWAVLLVVFADRMRNLGRYTFADVVAYRLHPRKTRVLTAIGTLAVAIPYLIAQMVGAGALVEALFGIPYIVAVLVVGVLMTIYVFFGGMLATSWVQLTKAVILLVGGTVLLLLALAEFDFDLTTLFERSTELHASRSDVVLPGGIFKDPISIISLALAFICGTAGLPHVLMRFFTVADAKQARRSIGYAVFFIGFFQIAVILIGFAAIALLIGTDLVGPQGQISGGGNMTALLLASHVGGEILVGLTAAVAFATILAVVAGVLLSASAAVAHDLYAMVIRRGEVSDEHEVRVSRIVTLVIGGLAIALSALFEGINVAILATIPLAIAASVNFPVLLLALYWPGFTTRGAILGGVCGLVTALALTLMSPVIWVDVLGNQEALFPYAYPTLFSVTIAFLGAVLGSVLDNSETATAERAAFAAQEYKSESG